MGGEIKFRAWDLLNKSFARYEVFIGSDGTLYADADPCGVDMGGLKKIRFKSQLIFAGKLTSHKDKNGVEIYDGDYVKVGGLVELVKYLDGILISYNANIYGHPEKITEENFESFIVTSSDYFNAYEVIGNIYKNPELLTK